MNTKTIPSILVFLVFLQTIAYAGQPDLYGSWQAEPGGHNNVSSTTTITATAHNGGDAPAGAFHVSIYYKTSSTGSPISLKEYDISSLGAGQSYSTTATFTCNSEGIFYIGMKVDTYNTVAESDENNNVAEYAYGCWYPKPNLKASISSYPNSACYGKAINIAIITSNEGEITANSSITQLTQKVSGSTSELALFNIPSLQPGSTHTSSYSYICNFTANSTSIQLTAFADYNNSVNESSEGDNKNSIYVFCHGPQSSACAQPPSNYSCSISPSSATITFTGSQSFTINCFSNNTTINCSNITSSFSISAPSFISINQTSSASFIAKPTSTAQGGNAGIITATATLSNGSSINCSAQIAIADTVNASCRLPSIITLPINTTVRVNVACFNGSQAINCTSLLLQPFEWSIWPTSSPYITIAYLDSYRTSANITAVQPDPNKSLLVLGKDLDNNAFACASNITFSQTLLEKCLILPVEVITGPVGTAIPSVKYEARCIDFSSNSLQQCREPHLLRVIGLEASPSPSISLSLAMPSQPPYAGFLIVSEDGQCSSFFHVLLMSPIRYRQ
ncbi:MAG: CARDB domain-containing protein [Candidatus Anstonellales archaeon]